MSGNVPLAVFELAYDGAWEAIKRYDLQVPLAADGKVNFATLCDMIGNKIKRDVRSFLLFEGESEQDPTTITKLRNDFVPVRNAVTFYAKPLAQPVAVPVIEAAPLCDDGLAQKRSRSREVYQVVDGLYNAVEHATLTPLNGSKLISALTLPSDGTINAPAHPMWLTDAELSHGVVYVRSLYYPALWSCLVEAYKKSEGAGKHLLIMGNPGIGKSWSLNYLLHMAVKSKLASLVMLHCHQGWFAFHDNKAFRFDEHPGRVWVNERSSVINRALVLLDAAKGCNENSLLGYHHGFHYGDYVCFVLAASPNKKNIHSFEDYRYPRWFVMPTWRKDEFLTLYPDDEAVFDTFGGTLRDISDPRRDSKLSRSIDSFQLSKAAIDVFDGADSSRIVMMVPKEGFEDYFYEYHTPNISRRMKVHRATLAAIDQDELRGKLTSVFRCGAANAFEKYVHDYCDRIVFSATESLDGVALGTVLQEVRKLKPPCHDTFVHEFGSKPTELDEAMKTVGNAVRWIKPKISNFPVFDAFLHIPTGKDTKLIIGVKITISDTHSPERDDIDALITKRKVSFGAYHCDDEVLHVDAAMFIVDSHRPRPMANRQNVARPRDGDLKVQHAAWNNHASFPQFINRVNCSIHDSD